MHFKILDREDKSRYGGDIIKILTAADREFVPPLSQRTSTLDKTFGATASYGPGVTLYFEEMIKQEVMGVFEDRELLGFVSYRLDYVTDLISENECPNLYVSTLVLSDKARGKGLTKRMYAYLFCDVYADRNVFTRTWSTNFAHTKILESFGFTEIIRKENDRGNGIDTVYYKREKSKALSDAGAALASRP